MNNIVIPLIGNLALCADQGATEPGIRRSAGKDSVPVVFDEFESHDKAEQDRNKAIIALARSSSSSDGTKILKAAAGGGVDEFQPRSMFCFSSIGVSATQRADITRISILELSPRSPEHFQSVIFPELQNTTLRNGFCESIRARTLANAATIHRNISTFIEAVTKKVNDRRLGDQLGTLMAGAWSLYSDAEISAEDALQWVDKHEWDAYLPSTGESDENQALAILVDMFIEIEDGDGKRWRRTVGETLEALVNDKFLGGPAEKEDSIRALGRYGIRYVGDVIAISNNNTELRRVFRDTPYADKWGSQFRRIDDITDRPDTYRINGVTGRVSWIRSDRFAKQRSLQLPDEDIPF